jgi:hypothetical protein
MPHSLDLGHGVTIHLDSRVNELPVPSDEIFLYSWVENIHPLFSISNDFDPEVVKMNMYVYRGFGSADSYAPVIMHYNIRPNDRFILGELPETIIPTFGEVILKVKRKDDLGLYEYTSHDSEVCTKFRFILLKA